MMRPLAYWVGLGAMMLGALAQASPPQRPGDKITFRTVTQALDGDTLRGTDGVRVRLWGIDAHEAGQYCGTVPCGDMATAHLVQLLAGKIQPCPSEKMHGACLIASRSVECQVIALDKWKRLVAACKSGGIDLGARMVADGYAFATSAEYQPSFNEARLARRGLHGRGAMVPEYSPKAFRDRAQ